jgi:uncharacterized protein (TIGR02452 family)
MLQVLPCLDSDAMADDRRRELDLSRERARDLGLAAVRAAERGWYDHGSTRVDWSAQVAAARAATLSIPPDAHLPTPPCPHFATTIAQVANETTLGAARRLVDQGLRVLALNFANGIHPGGGFLHGARAQEETLCRSSALHDTLVGDPMYEAHLDRQQADSTDWAILSPDVPVFRTDDGTTLPQPWPLSVLTCAAPVADQIGQPLAGDLLERRIHRVLAIAHAHGYPALVLGAWGCGAFGNDPVRTARDFRHALETSFGGAFSHALFAITDWSPNRRFLGPFRDAFDPPPP